ncbi:YEATS domain-containing protein 2 isoform X2 [Lithobates pipiens]
MSGIKRTIEGKDPDYEDISVDHQNKRHKSNEISARDATILKIESVVKDQFAVELKNKEHEIEVIDQRLNEARRMMDKLRAYIVANYYASAGFGKGHEGTSACDPTILNHPSIKKFLESPSRASSPANHRSDTPSVSNSETDSICTPSELLDKDSHVATKTVHKGTSAADEKLGKDSVPTENDNQTAGFTRSVDTSRRFVKKTLVVGNVSRYIPPDKREENDQSTHKWMVYVRGSRKEPSIHHFVKKVWFFLHPSYKPNDLVEVREPPFHLTRRGWGEFPVRVQIHFKDSQNKRIDIIHNLKLDKTYTGLQTLGAETVVEVELLRHSLGEDYLYSQSSNETTQSDGSTPGPVIVKTSSPHKGSHELVEKGFSMTSEPSLYTQTSALERTPTKMTQRFTIGAHGSTAFQPITASCKIVPQGQATSLAESPGKSFQPITMSCKIVSGSPTSKHSSISQAGTRSPLPKIHGSSFVNQNIKEETLFAAMPPLCPIGSHSKSQSPKPVAGGLGAFTKVIIKQEPVETSQQQQETPSTSQPSVQQIVTVKGNQMIAVSPQKNLGNPEGAKVVGIPVGSAVPASIKPSVTISGGQILVAKSSSTAAKAVGAKQMVAQGVAKAVVSSGSASVLTQSSQNLTKAQVASAKTGTQGSVMATLQLPSTNLGNLANLPPGTKLYLTTNSKSTSGKGKLLLIPQGAILRAANTANLQSGASSSGGSGTAGTSTGLPQHLTYTSYILKQTPQGTFLVGQPSPQTSGKQTSSNVVVQGSGGSSTQGQQTIKITAGQKSTLIAQANSGSAGLVKISENVLKSLPATSQTQKPGTTLLRVAGGVITTASTSLPSLLASGSIQQAAEGSSTSTQNVSSSKIHVQHHTSTAGTSLIKSLPSGKSSTLPTPVLSSRVALSLAPSSSSLTVKAEPDHSNASSFNTSSAAVKIEDNLDQESSSVKTEHLQNFKQLLTATVKKIPLISERDEDGSNLFCASSVEQYCSWNIGKRRASEWQRAVAMKKMLQEIIEKQPKFSTIAPLKTKEIVHWCRIHGYTPPDPESSNDDQESIEDVLTRIDNEASLPSFYSSSEALCRKIEELEKVLKKEREVDVDVDIISMEEQEKPCIKKENENGDDDKFYLTPTLSCEFIRDTAQEIGISLQPTEIQKNVYASPVEEMVLKATEQFVSDILRDALSVAYQMSSRKRIPREITISDIHQAICNIPLFDFLTNKHMGALNMDDELSLK